MGINGTPVGALLAACSVTAAGAFTTNSVPLGFSKVAIASSVYTLTLTPGFHIGAANASIQATAATDKQFVTVAQTDESTIVVKGWDDAGVAADTGFTLNVYRKS